MFSIVHHEELHNMIERNDEFVLLDVLPPESFMKHRLPGAVNVPFHSDNFELMAKKLMPDKSTPVVVYCKDLQCQASAKACQKLAEMGYKNVSDYEQGLAEWMELDYPLDQ